MDADAEHRPTAANKKRKAPAGVQRPVFDLAWVRHPRFKASLEASLLELTGCDPLQIFTVKRKQFCVYLPELAFLAYILRPQQVDRALWKGLLQQQSHQGILPGIHMDSAAERLDALFKEHRLGELCLAPLCLEPLHRDDFSDAIANLLTYGLLTPLSGDLPCEAALAEVEDPQLRHALQPLLSDQVSLQEVHTAGNVLFKDPVGDWMYRPDKLAVFHRLRVTRGIGPWLYLWSKRAAATLTPSVDPYSDITEAVKWMQHAVNCWLPDSPCADGAAAGALSGPAPPVHGGSSAAAQPAVVPPHLPGAGEHLPGAPGTSAAAGQLSLHGSAAAGVSLPLHGGALAGGAAPLHAGPPHGSTTPRPLGPMPAPVTHTQAFLAELRAAAAAATAVQPPPAASVLLTPPTISNFLAHIRDPTPTASGTAAPAPAVGPSTALGIGPLLSGLAAALAAPSRAADGLPLPVPGADVPQRVSVSAGPGTGTPFLTPFLTPAPDVSGQHAGSAAIATSMQPAPGGAMAMLRANAPATAATAHVAAPSMAPAAHGAVPSTVSDTGGTSSNIGLLLPGGDVVRPDPKAAESTHVPTLQAAFKQAMAYGDKMAAEVGQGKQAAEVARQQAALFSSNVSKLAASMTVLVDAFQTKIQAHPVGVNDAPPGAAPPQDTPVQSLALQRIEVPTIRDTSCKVQVNRYVLTEGDKVKYLFEPCDSVMLPGGDATRHWKAANQPEEGAAMECAIKLKAATDNLKVPHVTLDAFKDLAAQPASERGGIHLFKSKRKLVDAANLVALALANAGSALDKAKPSGKQNVTASLVAALDTADALETDKWEVPWWRKVSLSNVTKLAAVKVEQSTAAVAQALHAADQQLGHA